MATKVNEYIDTPSLFVRDIGKSIDLYIKNHQDEKSREWKERNDGNVVSGSIFSQCVRKAWYSFFTPPKEGEFNSQARKRMFLGYVSEEIVLSALKEDPANIDITVHHEQNETPVNQVIEKEGVKLSTTTDLVLEYKKEDGASVYIPVEEKSTEVSDYQRGGAGEWWRKFEGYPAHRRQLSQWMYYAKENGLEVPFGLLLYLRRANYDLKPFIILDAQEIPFSPVEDVSIDLYQDYKEIVEERIVELVASINNKTRPSFPDDVPSWLCKDCSFKEDCHDNK